MRRNSTVICQPYCTSLTQEHDIEVVLGGSWLADLTPLLPTMWLLKNHLAGMEHNIVEHHVGGESDIVEHYGRGKCCIVERCMSCGKILSPSDFLQLILWETMTSPRETLNGPSSNSS